MRRLGRIFGWCGCWGSGVTGGIIGWLTAGVGAMMGWRFAVRPAGDCGAAAGEFLTRCPRLFHCLM